MSVTVRTAAQQTRLTTLAAVKEELAKTDTGDDKFLLALLDRATATLERWTGRGRMARELVTEKRAGTGGFRMSMSRLPVVTLEAVRLEDRAVDLDDFKLEDPDAGFIIRDDNFFTTTERAIINIDLQLVPRRGEREWAFDYTAGWLLPADDIVQATDVTATAADKTYTTTTTTVFPLLAKGDVINVSGFANAGNNGLKTIASRDGDTKITVDETLVDESAGPKVDMAVRTLPFDLEEAAIELVKSWFKRRKHASEVRSERVGDFQQSIQMDQGLPPAVTGLLTPYRLIN